MASQGPLSGGTFTDDATIGTEPWFAPSDATSSNNVYAFATLSSAEASHYLRVTNFGFTIPAGANIDGVVVGVERNASSASGVTDISVRLYSAGAFIGSDKATATFWPTSDAYEDHGGTTDVWGAALTDSIVNASGFGVGVACTETVAIPTTASIDHIRITVYYTVAAGSGSALSQTIVVGI